MSKRDSSSNRDLSEGFNDFLVGAGRLLLWIGIGATLLGAGFMVFTCFATNGATVAVNTQAMGNVEILEKLFFAGLIALLVSTTYLMWGEQILGVLQILFAGLLYSVPLWLPSLTGQPGAAAARAMTSLQNGGIIFGLVAAAVLIVDITIRTKDRATKGAKADQMKYGKGIKEERQNVFLGKCWQLPFCRKFVRERCPIFHAKRTCWRELVGCMCEEEVIRNAMENKPISKDALLAANAIPRNNKLTIGQKRERCKSCVIYNEHQKHKYRALLPALFIAYGVIFFLGNVPLLAMTKGVVDRMAGVVGGLTLTPGKNSNIADNSIWISEVLLGVFFIFAISYSLKMLEYLVFKLKI